MQKKILEIAKYMLENKATISMTAEHFHLSVSSIKKYINDPDKLPAIDIDLYKQIKLMQEELQQIGHIVGGKNGVREPTYTEFEALEIAETMLSESLTLKEAEERFNIPDSTIYERLRAINDDNLQRELDLLFKSHKK